MLLQTGAFSLNFSQLLLVIYVLAPGYVAYQSIYIISNLTFVEDGFDKYLITIIAGVVSDAILIGVLAGVYSLPVVSQEIANPSVVTVILWVPPAIAIGLVLGIVVGLVTDRVIKSDVNSSRFRIWDRAFRLVNDPVEADVFTNDGLRISGQLDKFGTVSERQDLLIRYPTVSNGEGGEEVDIGEKDYLYISDGNISHVVFDELDLEQFPDELIELMENE